MKESTKHKIRVAIQFYKNGVTDLYLLAGANKVSRQTIWRWAQTDLWKAELGEVKFHKICHRRNIVQFRKLQKRYYQMDNISEHHKIGILLRDKECTVTRMTLWLWRRVWQATRPTSEEKSLRGYRH